MSLDRMTLAELAAFLNGRENLSSAEEELLKRDCRRGAAELLERYHRRMEARFKEEERLQKMFFEEENLWSRGFNAVAGVDESGRGPLAGPVVAAAVILDRDCLIDRLNDSKQLSISTREKIFDQIVVSARCYGLGSASSKEIDRLNIHEASMLAMKRALKTLSIQPDYVLVDGYAIRHCPFKQKAITGGDALSLSIAAASVLAKVSRDRIMINLHRQYPAYGFDRHMGYGTEEHRRALSRCGPCPAHRRSFKLEF